MNPKKTLPLLLGILSLLVALIGWAIGFGARDSAPFLIHEPKEARQAAEELMEAVKTGDFPAISAHLTGNFSLGDRQEPEGIVGQLVWASYLESLTYEIPGDCYASPRGVALDLSVTGLDFDSVIPHLGEETKKLLNRRISQAEEMDEIYDEDNQYRQDVLDEVLTQATRQVLEDLGETKTRELTLHLIYDGEQWRIDPDPELLRLISGNTAG